MHRNSLTQPRSPPCPAELSNNKSPAVIWLTSVIADGKKKEKRNPIISLTFGDRSVLDDEREERSSERLGQSFCCENTAIFEASFAKTISICLARTFQEGLR